MFKSKIAAARTFNRDENGSIAIIFGLSSAVMCMFVGLAFDVGRSYSSQQRIAAAADAAALSAAKGIRLENMTDAQAKAYGRKVFDEDMRNGAGNWTDVHDVKFIIDRMTSKVTVEVDASVKTTFAGLAGISKLASPAAATAVFEARDIEVAVQLDLTGSMCSPCSKIDALKDATRDLVHVLIPASATAQKVRVGFAPFSAGVNVGPYLRDVDGNRGSSNNCVYERRSSTNAKTDEAPIGTDAFKIRSDLTAPPRTSIQDCPAAEIVPLTSDRKKLLDVVDTFVAGGSTAGQLGAAWAWNLVSPKWKDVWPLASRPVDYGTAHTDKVVILMTDGVYNTIGGVNYGDTSTQATTASSISVDLCTNMKDAGVTVYTVGFDLDSIGNAAAKTRATDTLKACAGRKGNAHPEDFFFKAKTGDELRGAFNHIASDIIRLRLSN